MDHHTLYRGVYQFSSQEQWAMWTLKDLWRMLLSTWERYCLVSAIQGTTWELLPYKSLNIEESAMWLQYCNTCTSHVGTFVHSMWACLYISRGHICTSKFMHAWHDMHTPHSCYTKTCTQHNTCPQTICLWMDWTILITANINLQCSKSLLSTIGGAMVWSTWWWCHHLCADMIRIPVRGALNRTQKYAPK